MKDKLKGGLADNMSVKDLADKHNTTVDVIDKEIKKGVEVEKEHTSDSQVAKEIAKDHTYESPEYYENLKEELNEDVSLVITDETPETISILVQYNDRNAGIIMVTPANAKDTLEIVSIKFKKGYDTQFIISQGVQSLWGIFKKINHFIVAPELKGVELWNKMGFSRITKNYLISNRGH
jgi:predicted house-cleaning noncanonical NTP pyrophosphatase (MazG superfamily)